MAVKRWTPAFAGVTTFCDKAMNRCMKNCLTSDFPLCYGNAEQNREKKPWKRV